MLRLSKGKRVGVILLSVVALLSIGLATFYLVNGNSFDTRSSAGNSIWAVGDLNADQKVTMADFNIWLTGYRKNKKDGAYDAVPDLNKDKKVSFSDFFLWLNAYREYKNSSSETMKAITKTGDMGTFKLEYQYIGDNTWFYKVTGTFTKANSCDTGSVNIGITKNNNAVDIVNIYMNGTTFSEEPSVCTGTYTKEGEITASPNANIIFALRDLGSASVTKFSVVDVNYLPMTLTYEYIGNNQWSYAINGELPNGCFAASTSISITSFGRSTSTSGEKVYVFTYVRPPMANGMHCMTQSTVKYSDTGTFSANEFAKTAFVTAPTFPTVGLMTGFVPVLKTEFIDQGRWWDYTVTGTFPSGCYSATTTVSPTTAVYTGDVGKTGTVISTDTNATLWTVVKKNTTGTCTAATKSYSATGKIVTMPSAGLNSFQKSSILQ